MPQVVIPFRQLSPTASKTNEWILVELQGSLTLTQGKEKKSQVSRSELDGMQLGKLEFNEKGNPVLVIGQSRLEGRQVALSKPFAVLRKRLESRHNTHPNTPQPFTRLSSSFSTPAQSSTYGANTPNTAIDAKVYYDVVTILRFKYLFKNRPEPIISEKLRGLTSLNVKIK